jgi:glycine oxidase
MQHPDICIAGAGIIGLSLALELHRRGVSATVIEQGSPLSEASTAAAGMLAATDPDNPPRLLPLANLSLSLYPAFLERLRALSGIVVPFHTNATLQALPPHVADAGPTLTSEELRRFLPQLTPGDHRFLLLDEHSLDPRELAASLLAAVRANTIDLRPNTRVLGAHSTNQGVEVHTTIGTLHTARFVDCTGAWSSNPSLLPHLGVTPRKGQMLAVALPPSFSLQHVVRTSEVYIVPRTQGPNAGRAIIGATIENAGFDKTVHAADIAHLRDLAARLLPAIALAPRLEAWAGLRPATPDGLPVIGQLPGHPNHFLATGHYRNGILLAPATAHVMAQILIGENPSIDLSPFSPARILPEQLTP